jgi:aminomethyltransferase
VSDAAQKTTPLYHEHVRCGAKLVPFGGWLMPVQYSGIVDEHLAVRKNLGVFDISHMGQLIVTGEKARSWLNTMLTNNVERLDVGQGQYTFLLNQNGGIIDDLIAYRIGDAKFLLVVNASRTNEDFAWLNRYLKERRSPDRRGGLETAVPCGDINLINRSADFGGLAIQGPRVIDLFHGLLGDDVSLPARNQIADFELDGMPLSIARTGYTGEDGVEVFFRAQDAVTLWNLVLEKGKEFGIKPCGLGARDTLRLEMCYPLNGSDLSPERNPIEAGLAFFVDLNKPEFIGREKLSRDKEQGPAQKLAPFRMTGKGPPPRPHYAVFQDGGRIGEVTSGTLSPSLNYGIGMAYLPTAQSKVGTELEIEIRGQKFPAAIEKKPFYKKT